MIIMLMLMWFNWSVVTINTTFQLLDIYRLIGMRMWLCHVCMYKNFLVWVHPSFCIACVMFKKSHCPFHSPKDTLVFNLIIKLITNFGLPSLWCEHIFIED